MSSNDRILSNNSKYQVGSSFIRGCKFCGKDVKVIKISEEKYNVLNLLDNKWHFCPEYYWTKRKYFSDKK